MAFPRSAGNRVLELQADWHENAPETTGYKLVPPAPLLSLDPLSEGETSGAAEWPGPKLRWVLAVPAGAFLYSKPRDPNDFGALYQVAEDYNPTTEDEAFGPLCHYVLRDGRFPLLKAAQSVLVLLDSKDSLAPEGAFHQPNGDELFVVTHCVERKIVPYQQNGMQNVFGYFSFNVAAATNEINSLIRRRDGLLGGSLVEGEPLTLDDAPRPPRGTPRVTLAPPPSDGHPRPTLPEPESRGSLAEAAPTGTPRQVQVGICDHATPEGRFYASGGPLFATTRPTRLEVNRVKYPTAGPRPLAAP